MSDGRKNRLKYSSAWILCVAFMYLTANTNANDAPSEKFYIPLTVISADTVPAQVPEMDFPVVPSIDPIASPLSADTIPIPPDTSAIRTDTLGGPADSLGVVSDTLNIPLSKDSLDEAIQYSAADSIVFEVPEKKIILYTNGSMKKGDMDLTGDSIEIDQVTNLVTAKASRDSSGNLITRPKMVQGDMTTESDVIQYNTQTQKGLTRNTFTQQGEIYIQGEKIKKVSENDFYAFRGQFTTCNLDVPHFAFRTARMKLVNKKLAVTGPIHPEFEGVPVPIYLPFGIFPISQGRHSGFLPPQFTASEQFGLGLQGLGYYKVVNDNFDVLLRGDVYTYGGWATYFEPQYRKRYKYNGRMLFTLQRTRIISSDPKQDFTDTKTFNINWSHSVDGKARPGTSFSANVNAGSTKFNRLVQNNPMRNYNNHMNSSVTYSKTWDTRYNMTISANHSQNNNTGVISMNLPNAAFTASTIYPLQKKEFAGTPKWYEKLGVGLNTNFANQISFVDSMFNFRNLLDTMQWGAQHSIPIQLSLPQLGPIQISPGINYGERWFSRQFIRRWNEAEGKVDSTFNKGFFTARDVSFSLSFSTAMFGMFEGFGKSSAVRAVRHVIRPTASISYRPDLSAGNFYTDTINKDHRTQRFSKYDGAIYSAFSEGRFGGVSFGIDNNIEMKMRSKKDTGEAQIRKVRLLEGFGINGSYNLMADSFQLSPLSMYVRSTLFEKINITAGATLDPYQIDAFGDKIDRFTWSDGAFNPGRITNGNIAISTSFKSKPKDEKKAAEEEDAIQEQIPMTMEEQMAQMNYIRQNPAEFADFNIPWSVNLSYSLSFFRRLKNDYSGFETEINSNISVNGDFNLTPRWKMGVNTYYDFKSSSIQTLTMFISREMHCWQLSINVTPVGLFRSFNITVSPKSGILRDLRINRTRSFYGG